MGAEFSEIFITAPSLTTFNEPCTEGSDIGGGDIATSGAVGPDPGDPREARQSLPSLAPYPSPPLS